MFKRRIGEEAVRQVLKIGETIERYPDDEPYPSRLVLGWYNGRAVHVVVADNQEAGEQIVITVYEPDPERWQPDFRRRKA